MCFEIDTQTSTYFDVNMHGKSQRIPVFQIGNLSFVAECGSKFDTFYFEHLQFNVQINNLNVSSHDTEKFDVNS